MQLIVTVLGFLLARLREPSTHAGIATVLMAIAPMLPAYASILQAIAVAFGGVAVAKPDPMKREDQGDQGARW